jgi:tetratricopeptide (TPR) repeat protein
MYSGPVPRQFDRIASVVEANSLANQPLHSRERNRDSQTAFEPALAPSPKPGGKPTAAGGELETNPELARTAGVRERWESRWKVGGAEFEARSKRSELVPGSQKPPLQASLLPAPLEESPAPRGRPVVSPVPEPVTMPVAPPSPIETDDEMPIPTAIDQAVILEGDPADATCSVEPAAETLLHSRLDQVPAVDSGGWPSARDILAAHRATHHPQAAALSTRTSARRRQTSRAVPTEARGPGQWNLPAWLAGPPAALLVMAAGLAGCVLSWWWACDSYCASIMTSRLLLTDRSAQRRPLSESVGPPEGTWARSTAQHLAHWAIYLSRIQGEGDHRTDEIAALLERALQVSPLDPTARLAMAQLEAAGSGKTVSIRTLGLSRDVPCLAFSGRILLAAGEKEAALKLYGQALALATAGEPGRAAVVHFSEDPGTARYLLPREQRVRDIVRELVLRSEWTIAEWSAIIPDSALVRLAVARLLREQDRPEAETLIDLVLHDRSTAVGGEKVESITLAARAEAYALRLRWREAQEQYRQAIERCDDDTIRRSWWYNLADIALKLDDENQRQLALHAAVAAPTADDIARRATEIQRASRARPVQRSTGVKAN